MFSLNACHALFDGSWLIDYGVNCKGHEQGQLLLFASLPPPHKCNPREGCQKILFMSETWAKRTISNSKTLFASLLIELNTSKEVTPFHPFIQSPSNEFWDETFYGMKPLNDYCLPLGYKHTLSFDMSCDEYIEIFNKLTDKPASARWRCNFSCSIPQRLSLKYYAKILLSLLSGSKLGYEI